MDDKLLYRVDEAAKLCSLGRSKMYQLVMAGEVPSVRIGRAVRIPAGSLTQWVARQQKAAEQAATQPAAGQQ